MVRIAAHGRDRADVPFAKLYLISTDAYQTRASYAELDLIGIMAYLPGRLPGLEYVDRDIDPGRKTQAGCLLGTGMDDGRASRAVCRREVGQALFKSVSGTRIRHVPYKAPGPMRIDFFEGRIDMSIYPEGGAYNELVQSGRARALLVSGNARSALLPDVPTAEEVGLKGYNVVNWYGLAAPRGTPADVIDRINAALNTPLAAESTRQEFAREGHTPRPLAPAEFDAFLKKERESWAALVKATGAKPE